MRAIIIGAQGTGKTALFRRLTGLPQKDDDLPTHGILQTPHPIQLDGEHGPLLLDLLEISDEPRFMSLYALSAPDIAVLVYNTGSSKTSRRATELLFGQLRAHLDHRLPFLFVENENPSAVVVTEEIAKRMTAWTSKLSERYGRPLIKLNLKTGEGEAFLRAQLYECAYTRSRSSRLLPPRSFSSVPWIDGDCDPARAVPRGLFVQQRSWWRWILSSIGVYQFSGAPWSDCYASKVFDALTLVGRKILSQIGICQSSLSLHKTPKLFDVLSEDWPFQDVEFPYSPSPGRKLIRDVAEDGVLALYTPKCILKYSPGEASELCALIFLACNTGVRVPRVYQAQYSDTSPDGSLFLEHIEGETLEACLSSQSWLSRMRIYCKIRGMVQEMQRCQCDFPGSLDGSSVQQGLIFDDSPLPKPFVSSYDFTMWAIRQQDIERRIRRLRYPKDIELHIPDDFQLYQPSSPYPFCHYDLDWRNVMLTPEGEIVFIDFVTAGFYDAGLEHVPMHINSGIRYYAPWRHWRKKLKYYGHWLFMWFLYGRHVQAERFHCMIGQALVLNDRRQPFA